MLPIEPRIIPFRESIQKSRLYFPVRECDTICMTTMIRTVQNVGSLIRDRRKALGYTQARVANLCGTGTRFISDLENGKPSIELGKTLIVLAALGVDVQAIIRGEVE